ncbi:GUN4 domain-containing protein [Microcoleus sp. Pol12B4]|uniref:GUN4 domain-containing protein n=1 Tax=Microcoleus sp. Pol12B4 TaxID=3055395 RepID=UPI002FD2B508
MSKIPPKMFYYAIGLSLVILGITFAWNYTLFFILICTAIASAVVGCSLYILKLQLKQESLRIPYDENSDEDSNEDRMYANNRNIGTQGGNYHEQIQGDCINIQGNQIYLNQDLSQFIAQIQEILNQLQNQGDDAGTAKKQVINQLKIQIRRNSKIKAKFFRWNKKLGISDTRVPDENELAERIVSFATEESPKYSRHSILVIEGKYKKLYELLDARKWQEADEETLNIIYNLMPSRSYTYIDINQIPPKDLRKINRLWVKFSDGRFGLSVQKNIWLQILNIYNSNGEKYWIDDSVYNVFIDRVGWNRESNRIYHGDLQYSLNAPQGHLPAILMFQDPYYYSSSSSNYYHLNTTIFKALMDREYYKISFIPSWLEHWLIDE